MPITPRQSRCPAITAEPGWPGDGPWRYHTSDLASGGTSSSPAGVDARAGARRRRCRGRQRDARRRGHGTRREHTDVARRGSRSARPSSWSASAAWWSSRSSSSCGRVGRRRGRASVVDASPAWRWWRRRAGRSRAAPGRRRRGQRADARRRRARRRPRVTATAERAGSSPAVAGAAAHAQPGAGRRPAGRGRGRGRPIGTSLQPRRPVLPSPVWIIAGAVCRLPICTAAHPSVPSACEPMRYMKLAVPSGYSTSCGAASGVAAADRRDGHLVRAGGDDAGRLRLRRHVIERRRR